MEITVKHNLPDQVQLLAPQHIRLASLAQCKPRRVCPEQTKCVEGQFYNCSRQQTLSKKLMWYVYILLCNDGSLYTGSSKNPQQRFLRHKQGKGGRYTRSHKPIKLLYTEQHPDKSSALKRELQIKGWSRKKKIKILKLKIENSS